MWRLAHGQDERPVLPDADAKSIGAETTFLHDTDDEGRIRSVLLELSDKVAARLRAERVGARSVTLKFRDETFTTVTRSVTLERATQLADELHGTVLRLLTGLDRKGRRVRLVGVTAARLEPAGSATAGQMDLFDGAERARKERLATTLDDIRGRFGGSAIVRGSRVPARCPADNDGERE